MSFKPSSALIIADSGPLRSSILSLMNTIPQIHIVAESKTISCLTVMTWEEPPDLVLIDADLFGNKSTNSMSINCIGKIHELWPETRTLVLVESALQQKTVHLAGADIVVRKGLPAPKFIEMLENLL